MGNQAIQPNPIRHADIEQVSADPNGGIPNHPFLEVLIYRGVLGAEPKTEAVMALLENNGWTNLWHWTVHDYHHFHPGAHEVLACVGGNGVLHLGGESGPKLRIDSGDVVVLPAGFGHKRLLATDDFSVVGGYPEGQPNTSALAEGDIKIAAVRQEISEVGLPKADPVYGDDGPLLDFWRDRRAL